jgi:hypothetical protein
MKKIYKIILTLWISVGVGICGYFYIYPNEYRIYPKTKFEEMRERFDGPQYKKGKELEIYKLVTIVGIILISGIGFSIGKDNK